MTDPNRQTVDLSNYPDLVIVRAGMRAESVKGFWKLIKYGYQIIDSVGGVRDSDELTPEGLLHNEEVIFSLLPPHFIIRQYWRDFDSLEEWTQTGTHRELWDELAESPEGTSFWHELYSRDGIEAVYNGMDDSPIGMLNFAPTQLVCGDLSSARDRLQKSENIDISSPLLPDDSVSDDVSE
ncbi:MAG TPA: DUF4188 domain-containing protein [Halococcus sp.]|nr:DUF4188 domain-containing protein [Halococcus sp.]